MWELINESQTINDPAKKVDVCGLKGVKPGNTDDGSDILKNFYSTEGGVLKAIDPNHLLQMDVEGHGECGISGPGYDTIINIPVVDVGTFHDYSNNYDLSDQFPNGLKERISTTKSAHKPFTLTEAGPSGDFCTYNIKNIEHRFEQSFSEGISGYLPWYVANTCNGTVTYFPDNDIITYVNNYYNTNLKNN